MAVDLILASARRGNTQGLVWCASEHEIQSTSLLVDFVGPIQSYDIRNATVVSGVFNANDGLPNLRLTAPSGVGPQAHRYYDGGFLPIFNRQVGSPYGMYYRVFAKIGSTNRANIAHALCGFGKPDPGNHGFHARVRPVIGFYSTGGNWLCRVENGANTVDQFDTGVDPTTPRLLEIVVQPGAVRFYINGTLRYTSTLLFPADSPTNYQMLRYVGSHIIGDGTAAVTMDVAMEKFHFYWLASMTDPVLSEARLNVYRPSYFVAAFFNGDSVGEDPDRGASYKGRGETETSDYSEFNATEYNLGLWADTDKIWAGRAVAPTGEGDPNDAAAYLVFEGPNYPYWGLYNRFETSPIGWYFGALVRIEDLNRSSISLAFAGFGLRGNKATDKSPLVAFFVEGSSNWKCRVQDDASSGAVTDDFITTVDPTEPHFLEIIIIGGETRFYIDGALVKMSLLTFPPDSAAKAASWERETLFYIDGDNASPTAMRFGLVHAHTFERTTPVEYY